MPLVDQFPLGRGSVDETLAWVTQEYVPSQEFADGVGQRNGLVSRFGITTSESAGLPDW